MPKITDLLLNLVKRVSGLRIQSDPITNTRQGVDLDLLATREAEAMLLKFPDINRALSGSGLMGQGLKDEILAQISLSYEPAREAARRTRLSKINTPAARRAIAESAFNEGLVYSSTLKPFDDLWGAALPDIRAHEAANGGAVFTEAWPSLSRGHALKVYFSLNPPSGKVLHIAPEAELEAYFRQELSGQVEYLTLGLGADNDMAEDLTSLPLPDAEFDLVLCHRVLEHVFDEAAAMREIRRVLKPSGVLNVSVPEYMHLESAFEWCYPDATHHGHYRHYGSDFPRRLEAAGFSVSCERCLLDMERAQLISLATFPMRFYLAAPDV